MAYISLFLSAFIAATLFPAASEAYLLYLLQQGYPALLLWLVATVGNTAGGMLNYGLGRYVSHFSWLADKAFNAQQRERASAAFQKYGIWTLLFSWLPVIGDPLTFVAGLAKTRWQLALLLICTGKAGRYAILIAFTRWVVSG